MTEMIQKQIKFSDQRWDAWSDGRYFVTTHKPGRSLRHYVLLRQAALAERNECVKCGKVYLGNIHSVCYCDETLLCFGLRQGILTNAVGMD